MTLICYADTMLLDIFLEFQREQVSVFENFKLSKLRDLKGKGATDSRCFGYVSVANKGDVIIAHCIFW